VSKITREAATAFWHSKTFRSGNTEVYVSPLGYVGMFLHGNLIARHEGGKRFSISSCGWETKTTKDRLNGILEQFGYPVRLKQKGGKWFLGDHEWVNPEIQIGIVI
jgi:hypothetical protein